MELESLVQPGVDNVFSWQHINYTMPMPGNEARKLLSDVSGYVIPGKLTALMGESGAGKTTLLNVLSQRAGIGIVGGAIFMNGQTPPRDFQCQTVIASNWTLICQLRLCERLYFSLLCYDNQLLFLWQKKRRMWMNVFECVVLKHMRILPLVL